MTTMYAELPTLERNCCICGSHIYHSIWDSTVGEELLCKRELTNLHDRYVIVVVKDRNVIGHLLQKISHVCSFEEVATEYVRRKPFLEPKIFLYRQ